MKYAFGAILAIAALWMTSAASAQTGLYGSPELIPLPAMGAGAAQQPSYASPTAMQASAPVHPVATTPYATVPVSYGQGTTGPSLGLGQGPPDYLAQATPEPPAPLTPAPDAVPPAPTAPSELPPAASESAPAAPSVLDQLLQESGGAPGPACAAAGDCGYTCGSEYGDCTTSCEPYCESPWYIWGAGLFLSRDHGKRYWTTYETNNNPNQLMNTNDADTEWSGGGEIRLGRRFCCNQWAVEGTFWAPGEFKGYDSITRLGGGLSSPASFDYFSEAAALFDNADTHVLRRRDEIYNAEVNVFRTPCHDGPLSIDWMAGFRWFHFREHLSFDSLAMGGSWANPDQVGIMDDRIQNNLFGGQVGLSAQYYLGYNLSLFARPKLGIYNNHIEHRFNVSNGAGVPLDLDPGSGISDTFPGESSKDAFSVLAEIDLGLQWQFHPQWSAFLGYRLMAATNVALADEQIPFYWADIPEWKDIDETGHLLLHGAFAGLQYNF